MSTDNPNSQSPAGDRPAADGPAVNPGAQLIAEERERQISKEGWTSEADDAHANTEMASAAIAYTRAAQASITHRHYFDTIYQGEWPWGPEWWRPSSDPVRNLVKAGALIAAEIDRLQRRNATAQTPPDEARKTMNKKQNPEAGQTVQTTSTQAVVGDYVLATKYNDGDPQDHWCVGFYSGLTNPDKYDPPRYDVVDGEGKNFRGNGFRRIKKITPERGAWMLKHAKDIELYGRSVWHFARCSMKQLSIPNTSDQATAKGKL